MSIVGGVIIAQALTDATVDDATTGIDLIEGVDGDLVSVTADVAHATIAFHDAASAHDAKVVVAPAKTATVSRRRPRASVRDRSITNVKEIGRRQCLFPPWRARVGSYTIKM